MTLDLNETAARSLTHKRDSAAQSLLEVRHTDPASFLDDLRADFELDAVEDKIVRLAIINGPATLQQITPDVFVPGGDRKNPWFRAKLVAASYQARGQLVVLHAHCGVAWAMREMKPSEFGLLKTKECALQLQATMRRLQTPLQKMEGIVVRGGGVYVEDPNDPWIGHYMASIENPPPVVCRHCGEEIYYANEAFRHVDTKRAEALVVAVGRSGNAIKKLHHYAEPQEDEAA